MTSTFMQSLENSGMKITRNMLDSRKRTDERALEKEEEDYFNEERCVFHFFMYDYTPLRHKLRVPFRNSDLFKKHLL